jgi:hypothetical protein
MENEPTVVLAAQLFGHEIGNESLDRLISLAKQKGYPDSIVITDNPLE